jgi:hypothetical protein
MQSGQNFCPDRCNPGVFGTQCTCAMSCFQNNGKNTAAVFARTKEHLWLNLNQNGSGATQCGSFVVGAI